jgi:hypothetical protein
MSFVYLTPLFIYFPQVIYNIETQPFLIVIFAFFGLLFGSNHRAKFAFALLLIVHVYLTFILAHQYDYFYGSLRLLLLLFGPFLLFGCIGLKALPPSRWVMALIAIYFLCIGIVEFSFPEFYRSFALNIMDRANVSDGHRGISLLTPEPTYAAISVSYFLILARWSGKTWGSSYRWIEPALVLCLLATGSAYAILLIGVLVIVRWPSLIVPISATVCTIIFLCSTEIKANDESIRILAVASRLLAAINSNEILEVISYLDPSIGSRLVTNIASFLTPFYFPLGLGLDCTAVPTAFNAMGFNFAFENEVLSEQIEYGCIKPQSYIASIVLGFGVFSFFYLSLLPALIRYSIGKPVIQVWMSPLMLAAVILCVQGQISNPIPWVLIYFGIVQSRSQLINIKQCLF